MEESVQHEMKIEISYFAASRKTVFFMTGFLLSEVSVKFHVFGFCLGFSCSVHRIADSIQMSNVETSQRMQPLNPGHWFGDRGLKDPNACKKALTM